LHAAGEFEPWVIVPQAEGPLVDALREQGIPIAVLSMPALFLKISRERKRASLLFALFSLPLLLFYLCNGIKCHILGSLLAGALSLPLLWHIRDIVNPGITLRILRFLLIFARPWVVCNSEASAWPFRDSSRSRVIYNGFSWPLPQPAPNLRVATCAAENTVILGIVGVLARWKGQDLFLDLGSQLKKSGIDLRLVIVGGRIYDTIGDASFEEDLKAKALQLGLERETLFTGFVKNPLDYVRQFQALVHCSIRPEPFGRVIVEAMGAGTPVIAARAGGVVEIIQHGENGLLYEPGDLEDLSSKASELLRSRELAARLAANARERAKRVFSLESHVAAISSLYRQIS
jgi:glycosyltransferase involved in cell wall biosynthesis